MAKTVLKGITWGHSRGITPLVAYSQRFSELYPDFEVVWHKRSLQEFADYPIEKLTETYDLLIIDHPWVGCAAATRCVLPLDEYLPETYLAEQLNNSVGDSHLSYQYHGHQWALAIDAATPVASYRSDLLAANNIPVPRTWADVLHLAKQGNVAAPAIPIDLLMNFYMFCIAHGREPFTNNNQVIDSATGTAALQTMKQFYSLLPRHMFNCNPIAVAELMTKTNDYCYCPFAYGYSNYARLGYAKHLLTYDGLVTYNQVALRSTIGGTGLAVSAASRHTSVALLYAAQICSPQCQSTFYVQHGGQPGHLAAWADNGANQLTNNYFKNTLPTMQAGYTRPRYNGYLHFQDQAGQPIYNYLLHGSTEADVLEDVNEMYRHSLQQAVQNISQ